MTDVGSLLARATTGMVGWLSLAVAVGCGDAYQFETSTQDGFSTRQSSGGLPALLALVESAKDTTAFRGERIVRSVRREGVIEAREDVGADGTGAFTIELLEVLSVPPGFDQASFPIQYESAARFHWQLRDFRLRGVDRTLDNYAVAKMPETPVIAGIPCERLELLRTTPIGDRPGHYQVDFDPQTGFVLAWSEFDELDQVIYQSSFETFAYDGFVGDLILRDRAYAAQALDLGSDLQAQAGMLVREPDVLPVGFDLVRSELMDVPASIAAGQDAILRPGPWVRFLATDGVETISFTHAESPGLPRASIAEIRFVSLGGWEVGFGEYAGTSFAVAGRVSANDLRRIVESSF
ncbi:MAG: hypothetical protein AAF726_14495 [Planctomycetota bacterium]